VSLTVMSLFIGTVRNGKFMMSQKYEASEPFPKFLDVNCILNSLNSILKLKYHEPKKTLRSLHCVITKSSLTQSNIALIIH